MRDFTKYNIKYITTRISGTEHRNASRFSRRSYCILWRYERHCYTVYAQLIYSTKILPLLFDIEFVDYGSLNLYTSFSRLWVKLGVTIQQNKTVRAAVKIYSLEWILILLSRLEHYYYYYYCCYCSGELEAVAIVMVHCFKSLKNFVLKHDLCLRYICRT